jgi:hypothetical protein
MVLPAIAGMAAAGMIGGALGGQKERAGLKRQEELAREQLNRILSIEQPELREVELAKFENTYNFSPEEMRALALGPSAMEGAFADEGTIEAQRQALRQLQELSEGGVSEADIAAMQDMQLQAETAERGQRGAILQSMARRGMAGGGQELAASLAAEQGTADRLAGDRRNLVQGAQQRALQALSQSGQLAGSMRGQDFGEKSARANAADRIAEFNMRNRQRIADANVTGRNLAGERRATIGQEVSQRNVGLTNQELAQANEIAQANYTNKLNAAMGAGNFSSQIGTAAANIGKSHGTQTRQMAGTIGSLGAMGLSGMGGEEGLLDQEDASQVFPSGGTTYA